MIDARRFNTLKRQAALEGIALLRGTKATRNKIGLHLDAPDYDTVCMGLNTASDKGFPAVYVYQPTKKHPPKKELRAPKFTKGPWLLSKRDAETFVHTLENDSNPVAHVFCVYGGDRDANAALIAAAPELYAFARLFIAAASGLEGGMPALSVNTLREEAIAALAKAVSGHD